jgi:hypothetical protein
MTYKRYRELKKQQVAQEAAQKLAIKKAIRAAVIKRLRLTTPPSDKQEARIAEAIDFAVRYSRYGIIERGNVEWAIYYLREDENATAKELVAALDIQVP